MTRTEEDDVSKIGLTQTPPSSSLLNLDVDNIPVEKLAQKFGPDAYFYLDVVKKRLIQDVQNSTKEITSEIEYYSKLVVSGEVNVTRAIMAYLPPKMSGFEKQFKSLYLSIAVMRSYQTSNIKTDMLIFSPDEGQEIPLSLGCVTEERLSFEEPEKCVVMNHIETKNRPPLEGGVLDPLMKYANYLDSINILAEYKTENPYDYLMRVDLDTFITPGFGVWLPSNISTLVVGKGGYGSTNVNKHLKWTTTKKLGLKDSGLLGLGSTWYGASRLMIATAKTTVSVMRWLHTQEFSEYERCCNGIDGWPYWHWAVLLLYGGHIALNQLGSEHVQLSANGVAGMDASSTSNDTLKDSIKHIHCWHTGQMFSKFAFASGKYSNIDLTEYMNMNTSRNYVSTIAISSDRLSSQEIKTYVADQNLIKENKWIRKLPNNSNSTS